MILPQISYNDGSAVNFVPAYPPKGKQPVDALEAIRHDSITSAGLKQSITERIDAMQTFTFPFVPQSDIASWVRFFTWALNGGQFTYYPDSTQLGTSTNYTMEDMTWVPKFVAPGWFTFSMKFRKVVT